MGAGLHLVNAGRRHAAVLQLAIESLQVQAAQLGERDAADRRRQVEAQMPS